MVFFGEYREIIYNGDERYKIICKYINGKLHEHEWINEQLIRKQTFHNAYPWSILILNCLRRI